MKKQLFIAMALLSLGVTSCKDDVTFDQETANMPVALSRFIVKILS